MSDEFYITLPSTSNRWEFNDNQANHFKTRLPHPIRVEGAGWKVGLSSISLPDDTIDLTRFHEYESSILRCKWLLISSINKRGVEQTENATMNLKFEDIHRDCSIVDGVSFMKNLIVKFDQVKNFKKPVGYLTETDTKKLTEFVFKWEREELVLDNTRMDTQRLITTGDPYEISFNEKLAFDMGWVRSDKDGNEVIGPNLKREFYTDKKPSPIDVDPTRGNYWNIRNKRFYLSVFCNWRFVNMNKAFQKVIGSDSRSLFVYCDAGGSTVVGNKVTDLLREVNYRPQGKGNQYFKPLHIQYIPLRKDVMDIIETQVSETTGELTRFGDGDTILTLHFKRI